MCWSTETLHLLTEKSVNLFPWVQSPFIIFLKFPCNKLFLSNEYLKKHRMRGRERESKSFSHSLCPPQRPPVVEMGCNLGVGNFIHISHKGQGTPLLLPPRTGITRELTSGARSKSNTFVTASLNAGSQRLTCILKVAGTTPTHQTSFTHTSASPSPHSHVN